MNCMDFRHLLSIGDSNCDPTLGSGAGTMGDECVGDVCKVVKEAETLLGFVEGICPWESPSFLVSLGFDDTIALIQKDYKQQKSGLTVLGLRRPRPSDHQIQCLRRASLLFSTNLISGGREGSFQRGANPIS